jgi:PAS domain S-box-containing protein
MNHPFQCHHAAGLVVLSYTISVLGSYCALQWAGQIRTAKGWLRAGWVTGAAVAMGGGAIWSMHFIAMIACSLPVPVRYDVTLTLGSLLVAVFVTGLGLYVVSVAPSTKRLLTGGTFTGLGVAAMHYTGMAAMRLDASITYQPTAVIASVAIAIVAATAALWIAFNARSYLQRGLSSVVMGGAVSGMHYTAMAAAIFVPTGSVAAPNHAALQTGELGYLVFAVTLFVLVLLSLGRHIIDRAQVAEVLRRAHGELERLVRERTADLERQRTFLRQVIDISPHFIFAKDRDGRFTLVNRAVAEVYGTTAEELVGKRDADFNPNAEEVAFFLAADREVMDSRREKVIAEERITDSAGQVRWLETIKRPILGEDGIADQILGVSTDMTDRRRLEEQLRQSQKMEAIGTLAGGVAHDFNNFLTVIRGHTELLRRAHPPGDPSHASIETIGRVAERAESLTAQLLAFSRKQLVEPRVLDLGSLVVEMDRMLQRLVGEDVELRIALDPALGRVRTDRGQMDQVLMNLVVNARDAMPQGGRLTITCVNARLGAADAREQSQVVPGEYVLLEVRDDGCGIEPAIRARIFEPFFTTKEVGRGTGLGLSTVYGIVKQNGGHVSVDSQPGKGSSFKIYLPRVEGEASEPEVVESLRERPGGETVLVIEDEDEVRELVSMILGQEGGFVVLEARNGDEAVRLAGQAGPIQLVITDGVMPGIALGDMIATLRSLQPRAKVLLMSGYTGELKVRLGSLGSDLPFLAKPFTSDALLRKVGEVLDSP